MTQEIRGSIIEVTAVFADVDGVPVDPESAFARFDFLDVDLTRTSEDVVLSGAGGTWTGLWDSAVAQAGKVHVSVRSTNPQSAQDLIFDLLANYANPAPV